MWRGYLAMGGAEILNGPRAYGYTRSLDEVITWLQAHPAIVGTNNGEGLRQALGGPAYDIERINEAPWFDYDIPESARFYGAFPLDFQNISSSTRTATLTEGILDGGTVSGRRRAIREPRFRAFLTAHGGDALAYGLEWLDASLSANRCGVHGVSCGVTDITYYSSEPHEIGIYDDPDEHAAAIQSLVRQLHGVSTVSGPLVLSEYRRGDIYGAEVEFTLAAEQPYIYTLPQQMNLPPSLPSVVQDMPYNLETHPSAELDSGIEVVIARNLSTNPSVEVNADSWSASAAAVSGTDPTGYFTSGRTVDYAADGVASFRGVLTGTSGASGTALISLRHEVMLTDVLPGERVSFRLWGAALKMTDGTIQSLSAQIEWWNSEAQVDGTSMGSTTNYGGEVFSVRSLHVPAGADRARVVVGAVVDWTATSVFQVFADAVTVSIP